MADAPSIHTSENSPEYVAYRLLLNVAYVEDKKIAPSTLVGKADRKWLLDTYAECLKAVRDPHSRSSE